MKDGKEKGALVALLAGAPSSSESGESSENDHGFRAVAKAFGIPPEREASAKEALKSYIRACMAEGEPTDDDEEY